MTDRKAAVCLFLFLSAFFAAAEKTDAADFISVKGPVPNPAKRSNTAVFVKTVKNRAGIKSAKWNLSGLGVFRAYINGKEVGADDFLKPGYTHLRKRRSSFLYDVTHLLNRRKGEENVFCGEVLNGWWRDAIVGRYGKKCAFWGELEIRFEDGTGEVLVTDPSWKAAYSGPVRNAEIWGGEYYDSREPVPWRRKGAGKNWKNAEKNRQFRGVVSPMEGRTVRLRHDLALDPAAAWVWKGADGASEKCHGRARILRRYGRGDEIVLEKGEKLVVDFAQNCAGVPDFEMTAARGVLLFGRPAEMLNDMNGEKSRGNDGPAGSAYFANYRAPLFNVKYVFSGSGVERYRPGYTYFGGRYWSFTASGRTVIRRVRFVPVMSIAEEDETGSIETGHKDINRLILNCVWGMRSNYLSVPTDCPQRNERWGWSGDTQVFAGAAVYVADVYGFLSKWMTDMRDSQMGPGDAHPGSYRVVAPDLRQGMRGHNIGWSDAGVIVPWTLWKQFGDTAVIDANWDSMVRFMSLIRKTKYVTPDGQFQTADWLSMEKYESWRRGWGAKFAKNPFWPGESDEDMRKYWNFLGACYRISDLGMMRDMAAATGRNRQAESFEKEKDGAIAEFREKHLSADGLLPEKFRDMQTPALYALRLGLLPTEEAVRKTAAALRASLADNGFSPRTGFLGTPILLDTFADTLGDCVTAYDILLQRGCPGWLYSVDQGATTIWERWDGYTKEHGFGPVAMNSFNHYAYGAVLGWMYRTMAGIRPGEKGGYREFILCPRPDRRIGRCKASLRTRVGVVKSEWKYEGPKCVWRFMVPEGASADVIWNGTKRRYSSGEYELSSDG